MVQQDKQLTEENHPLEQLFGSKTRIKLLLFFLKNKDKSFYVRELTRILDVQINSIRRELENIKNIGIINVVQEDGVEVNSQTIGIKDKKYYKLNEKFVLLDQLTNLFLDAEQVKKEDYIKDLTKISNLELLILTGSFVDLPFSKGQVDLFIVGDVDETLTKNLIKKLETNLSKELNFTIMTLKEFLYRKKMSDKFLNSILNMKKIVVLDKTPKEE